MSSWVRTDADFGKPMVRLTLDMRSEVGRRYRDILGGRDSINTPQSMKLLCATLTGFIEEYRPDLAGLQLLCMNSAFPGSCRVEFVVSHQSLERVPMSEQLPAQRLETCWTCGKPLGTEATRGWMRDAGREVCSEACVTRDRSAPYRDPVSGKVHYAGDYPDAINKGLTLVQWMALPASEMVKYALKGPLTEDEVVLLRTMPPSKDPAHIWTATTAEMEAATKGQTPAVGEQLPLADKASDAIKKSEERHGPLTPAELTLLKALEVGSLSYDSPLIVRSTDLIGRGLAVCDQGGELLSITESGRRVLSMQRLAPPATGELLAVTAAGMPVSLPQDASGDMGCIIAAVAGLPLGLPASLVSRCSVCGFPLGQDAGALGDKCSLHRS